MHVYQKWKQIWYFPNAFWPCGYNEDVSISCLILGANKFCKPFSGQPDLGRLMCLSPLFYGIYSRSVQVPLDLRLEIHSFELNQSLIQPPPIYCIIGILWKVIKAWGPKRSKENAVKRNACEISACRHLERQRVSFSVNSSRKEQSATRELGKLNGWVWFQRRAGAASEIHHQL